MLTAVAVPVMGGHGNGHGNGNGHQGQKRIRVRPLSSQEDISPTERRFYNRARFETAADAMRAVASRGMTAEIYTE